MTFRLGEGVKRAEFFLKLIGCRILNAVTTQKKGFGGESRTLIKAGGILAMRHGSALPSGRYCKAQYSS